MSHDDHHHDHDHDPHGHDHGHHHHHHHHDGDHDHDHAHEARRVLERGAGRGKLLYLDCQSGIAGDMTIAALVDLGVPLEVVKGALAKLPLEGYELSLRSKSRSGIAAAKFDVHVTGAQPHRHYSDIDAMLEASALDGGVKALARRIFRHLGEAEAETHRVPLAEVHFHEVGAVDAIVDIVGASALLDHLGAELCVSPLPMGSGHVKADHGILPLPAPATVTCLRGVPTYGVELRAELVTPTGAAIAAAAAARFSSWPAMAPLAVGWGSGTKDFPDRPNLLRAVLGDLMGDPTRAVDAEPTHAVLEANVDDMTGELAGHAIAQLMAAGALDAWATPITMKKGRPGLCLAALAPRALAGAVGDALLRETTSIGLRTTLVSRVERPRERVEVDTPYGRIPLKVSGREHAQVKPEFDACAAAAAQHGVPVRVVIAAALAAYR
jgi:uncharacterized protein (TIGR00299 family) protein